MADAELGAPDAAGAELAAPREEITALMEELQGFAADLAETLADNIMMARVFEADDRIKAVMDEAKRQRALAENAEHSLAARTHEFCRCVRPVK